MQAFIVDNKLMNSMLMTRIYGSICDKAKYSMNINIINHVQLKYQPNWHADREGI